MQIKKIHYYRFNEMTIFYFNLNLKNFIFFTSLSFVPFSMASLKAMKEWITSRKSTTAV